MASQCAKIAITHQKMRCSPMSKKIFIDPGHGGQDPGAIGAKSKEAENVLKVALALEKKLIAQGYEVRISRRTDTYLSLTQRAQLANAWGADIFLSLHDNSAVNKSATGFETYIFNGSVSSNTVRLQQFLHQAIVSKLGLRDRGMKRANFAVIRLTNMPAVLIEYGFISNPDDEKIIAIEIEKQAKLTFEGINNYFGVTAITPKPPFENTNPTGDDEVMLTETGRDEIRALLKKARDKGVISAGVHTDAKINQYSDVQLLSYQAAVINRTFV